jgi:hypothetical protein
MMPSDRDDECGAADRVRDHLAIEREHLAHEWWVEHRRGRPDRPDAALAHRDEHVGVARGEVEIVQHHHAPRAGG